MSFADSIRTVLSKYADFSGRARRSEYWYWFLAVLAVNVVLVVLSVDILRLLFGLAVLIPGIAVAVRRLHDTGRSGWWILIALIPLVGAILLIVWLATDSDPAPNQYGPSPKEAVNPGGYGQPPTS